MSKVIIIWEWTFSWRGEKRQRISSIGHYLYPWCNSECPLIIGIYNRPMAIGQFFLINNPLWDLFYVLLLFSLENGGVIFHFLYIGSIAKSFWMCRDPRRLWYTESPPPPASPSKTDGIHTSATRSIGKQTTRRRFASSCPTDMQHDNRKVFTLCLPTKTNNDKDSCRW